MRRLPRTRNPTRHLNPMRDRNATLGLVRDHLADIRRTGTLELRSERGRRPAYCVRFRYRRPDTGGMRQRRLVIGDDPVLHDLVRSAITARVRGRLQAKAAKAEAVKRRKQAREAEREFMTSFPGSRSYRRQVRRAYRRSLVSGEHFIVEMYHLLASLPRRKRPGRPLSSRLW